jgi:hypothetical protein
MLQQAPIVVDVVKQPPVAQEITMGDVVLGAVGLTGVIMILALTVGLVVGAVFIILKRRRETAASHNPGSEILRM